VRFDCEIRQCVDQHLFYRPDIGSYVSFPIAKVQDGITYYLSRTMIRHIASPVGPVKFDPGAGQHFRAGQEVFLVAISADRDDMRMLDDQELVSDLTGFAARDQSLLDLERLRPTHASEILELIASSHGVARH
jgi:hypothetical protein